MTYNGYRWLYKFIPMVYDRNNVITDLFDIFGLIIYYHHDGESILMLLFPDPAADAIVIN